MTDDLSRRQLFTEACLSASPACSAAFFSSARGIHEWAGAESAPLYRWVAPSFELVDALRELDESTQRLHPEWFPVDMPDPRYRDAFGRWLDEREEQLLSATRFDHVAA